MNIGHISSHACPRALKLARTQQDAGHRTFLLADQLPSSRRYDGITHITKLLRLDVASLVNAVKSLDATIDVWHVHNPPDWTVTLVKGVSEKPVVYDVHDITSQLFEQPQPDELEAYKAADAILTAGKGQLDMIAKQLPYKIYDHYPPAMPVGWFPTMRQEPLVSRLVMPVGLSLDPGGYRNLLDGFNYIVEEGVPLTVYSPENEVLAEYREKCKATMSPCIPEKELHKQLVLSEAGLVGSFYPHPLIEVCEPNKFYEYIACGIPSIVVNAGNVAKIVKDSDLGIVCGLEDVPKAFKEIRQFRENVQRIRNEFSMEAFVGRVYDVYKRLGVS